MQGMGKYKIIIIILFCVLAGCATIRARNGTTHDQMHLTLQQSIIADKKLAQRKIYVPRGVSNALLPSVIPSNPEYIPPEHRFNVSADKMPAKTFFMGLVEGTPTNMVVSPDVTGTISLKLKNVTIDETMQIVQDVYGYEYRKTSYGYEVLPQVMETKMFTVNYLDVKRNGKSLTELNSGEITQKITNSSVGGAPGSAPQPISTSTDVQSGSIVDTRSEVNFWKDLGDTLKTMIGTEGGRSVTVNSQAGVVLVRAMPNELHHIGRFLARIQTNMSRQVILEAKILEVTLDDAFRSGINWNVFGIGNAANNEGGMSQFSTNTFEGTDLKDFSPIFTLNAGKGKFNLLIKMLQTQGNVQVLSSPRISTVNNQKAVIKVGRDEFFVTGVSTENTVTANSTIPTQDVTLTPFFSGITFDVTPQISGDDVVILHIHPSVSDVKEQTKQITLGQTANNQNNTLTLPLALSTIRESDNVVKAKNGQIVVIGGLMSSTMVEEAAGVPGASKIPFLGAFFRRTDQVAKKTELIILLRPIIASRKAFVDDLEETDMNFQRAKRGFHQGGLPRVFGNDGETDGQ